MRFTMQDAGFASYKPITSERKKVGSVVKRGDVFVATIGAHRVESRSERDAFDRVAALALGFETPQQLDAHNSVVRRRNKARRANMQAKIDRLLGGDFSALDDLIKKL